MTKYTPWTLSIYLHILIQWFWCSTFDFKWSVEAFRHLMLFFFFKDSSCWYKNTLMEHIVCSMVQIKIVRCIACSNSNDYLALYIVLRLIETFFLFLLIVFRQHLLSKNFLFKICFRCGSSNFMTHTFIISHNQVPLLCES